MAAANTPFLGGWDAAMGVFRQAGSHDPRTRDYHCLADPGALLSEAIKAYRALARRCLRR